MNYKITLAVCALALAGTTGASRADEIADKGRAILDKYEHAVVTVEAVLKVTGSGRATEIKEEITGTVVDPAGLTVVALSAVDPTELNRRLSEDYKTEAEISDVKLLLDDGTELPAEIVLRDRDLDLAYIRLKAKPASPMAAVDLSKSGSAKVLEEFVTLNRLGRVANRAYSASVERVTAVIQRPKTMYIPDSTMTTTGLGSPAFLAGGEVLGLIVQRAVNAKGSYSAREVLTTIVLPADDILKGAKQAPEAKGDSDKKDAPADSAKDGK